VALVALLRGVNVGGYKTFRPSVLAHELARFDVVNVGAAGTFVIRKRLSRAQLRAEITRRLPFEADVMICDGRDIIELIAQNPFAGQPSNADVVHFVSVLARAPRSVSNLPLSFPATGEWGLKVLAQQRQFVLGMYRRQMRAISYLGQLEKIIGERITTRNWSTMLAIGRVLEA
jgi:uncharacterized protein (DUF1697 family)